MRGGRQLASLVLVAALMLAVAPRPVRAHDAPQSAGARPLPPTHPSLGVVGRAPPFTLGDPEGRPVSLTDFAGRIVLLAFIYTSCPSACPLVTQRMAVLQRRLTAAGLFPSRGNFVSVTVDPDPDTTETLARYPKGFGADPRGWKFLRDASDALRPMLAAWDEWTKPPPAGGTHPPARLYLIDGGGRVRRLYTASLFDSRPALLDI